VNADVLVSVIVPVFNKAAYLAQAIMSVISQSWTNWELLLIDDGSTDGSGEICDTFTQTDERIHVVHTINRGVSAARNLGMQKACGEWLIFLDADDILPCDALCRLLQYAGDADIVFGGMALFPVNTVFPVTDSFAAYTGIASVILSGDWVFLPSGIVSACAKLYRRSSVTAQFDEQMQHAEDFCFNLACLPAMTTIHLIPEVVYHYRWVNEPTLNKQFWLDRFDICRDILHQAQKLFDSNSSVVMSFEHNFAREMCEYFWLLSRLPSLSRDTCMLVMQTKLDDPFLREDEIKRVRLPRGQGIIWHYILQGSANRLYYLLHRWGKLLRRWR